MERKVVNSLLRRMQAGDVRAFEELYDGMFSVVCSLVYSILLDYQLTEDIAQETFIAVGSHIGEYRAPYNGVAWIATIAKNLARNARRKTGREICAEELRTPETIPSPETDVESRDDARRLLVILPETERQIVALHLIEDMTHKDIARMLGLPLGTVLSKYYRSLEKLKACASERSGSYGDR